MSRLNSLLLLLIGASTLFTACTKSVNTMTPAGQIDAVITGNQWVSGGTWTSTGAQAVSFYAQAPAGYTKTLLIAATQTSGTSIHGAILLTITNYQDTAGSFNIDNSTNLAEYLTTSPDTVVHQSLYGNVTITKGTDKNVYGYFSFTCKDSAKVTNGTFNLNIQAK